MRATNMKKAISKTRLLLAPVVAVVVAAHGDGACCGSRHHRPDLQPDGATRLPHPAGRADDLLLGLRLQRRADRLCRRRRSCRRDLPHDAGSRPDADRHGRTDRSR